MITVDLDSHADILLELRSLDTHSVDFHAGASIPMGQGDMSPNICEGGRPR